LASATFSVFLRSNFFVVLRNREILERDTSSFSSITLEVVHLSKGGDRKAPGEPLELAPQANPLWSKPPGILSTSRIAPNLKIPTTFIRESFEAVIEKDVLVAFYRAALTSGSVWSRSALSNYAAGRLLNVNVDIVRILRIWPNIVSVSGSDG
jgi:hypothetical protein